MLHIDCVHRCLPLQAVFLDSLPESVLPPLGLCPQECQWRDSVTQLQTSHC